MKGYFLQTASDPSVWEEVDEYTYQNWEFALDPNKQPRYTGNRVHNNGTISVDCRNLSERDMAIISRFCGVRENAASGSVPGGFVRKPEFIRFQKRTKMIMHELGGDDYVCRKTVKPERTQVVGEEL